MGPLLVVFPAPRFDFPPRIEQIPEPTHVQTLIPKPSMKALHVSVLGGLPRLNMNQVDPVLDVPSQVP
jgi:hypothetical protein